MTAKQLCKEIAEGKWDGAVVAQTLRDAAKEAK